MFSKHFKISMVKSAVRIVSALAGAAFNSVLYLGLGLAVAEVLGIIEEIFEGK